MLSLRAILMGAVFVVVATNVARAAPAKRRDLDRVHVEDVIATGEGDFVVILKAKSDPPRYLPIWIGEAEAVAIRLRLDRRDPPRPLTLNLLEDILESSRIKLVEIQIDAVKGGVFLGRLRLKQSGRAWEVDARPSDAIGLALGRGAPIWVSREVMNEAAINLDDILRSGGREPSEVVPPAPGKSGYEETL